MNYQHNSTPEPGHEQKYEIGIDLTFTGYSAFEISVVPCDTFTVGDRLVVLAKNGCGMGIDVIRPADQTVDMVWPEEVELLELL